MDDYSAQDVPFKAGVEEAFRVLQRSSLGEGHPHVVLVRLARANDPAVRPYRNAGGVRWLPPFDLLDDFGVGLLDESTDLRERLSAPIVKLLYPRVSQLRGRLNIRRATLLLHAYLASLGFLRTISDRTMVEARSRKETKPVMSHTIP